jgi:hypothetical protein
LLDPILLASLRSLPFPRDGSVAVGRDGSGRAGSGGIGDGVISGVSGDGDGNRVGCDLIMKG